MNVVNAACDTEIVSVRTVRAAGRQCPSEQNKIIGVFVSLAVLMRVTCLLSMPGPGAKRGA